MNGISKSLPFSVSFLIVVSVLICSNCSSNGEGESEKAKLLGHWKVTSFNIELMIDGKSFTQYLIDEGFPADEIELAKEFFLSYYEDAMGDAEIELKDDNTYFDGRDTGKWLYDESSNILTTQPDDFNSFDYKVKSVTSSTLELKFELINDHSYYAYNGTDIDDGIDAMIELTLAKS